MRVSWCWIAACVVAAGCIEDPRARDEVEADGGAIEAGAVDDRAINDRAIDDVSRDGGALRDVEGSPDGASAVDAGRPRDTGVGGRCVVRVETFATDEREWAEPVVGGAAVYAHRLAADGTLRAVRIDDGSDALAGGPRDRIVDARGPARLLLRPDGAGRQRLIYRDAGGDVPLGDLVARWPGFEGGYGRPMHQVEPGTAAWLDGSLIHAYRGGRSEAISLGPGYSVAVSDGIVAWIGGDPPEVWVNGPDDVRVVGQARGGAGVVVTHGHVWWLDEGAVWMARVGERQGHRVSDVEGCEAIDADGPVALAACRDAEGMSAVRLGAEGEAEVLHRAAFVAAPRAEDGALAWASYDEVDAFCSPGAMGRLWWWPRGEPAPLDVAMVGSGCMCCDAIWPPLTIDLGEGLVAWNYASGPDAPSIGVARCR